MSVALHYEMAGELVCLRLFASDLLLFQDREKRKTKAARCATLYETFGD